MELLPIVQKSIHLTVFNGRVQKATNLPFRAGCFALF